MLDFYPAKVTKKNESAPLFVWFHGDGFRQGDKSSVGRGGGKSSYMSVMGVANSLMLDFRVHILPRFVYATGESFGEDSVNDPDLQQRLKEFSDEITRVTQTLCR